MDTEVSSLHPTESSENKEEMCVSSDSRVSSMISLKKIKINKNHD